MLDETLKVFIVDAILELILNIGQVFLLMLSAKLQLKRWNRILVLENLLRNFVFVFLPKGATSTGILLEKSYLSIPYDLPDGSLISGRIVGIRTWTREPSRGEREAIHELIGKNVRFVLRKAMVGSDYLLLSTESWGLLRDYAILPGQYYVKVALEEATFDEGIVRIYPARDLVLE